MIGPLRKALLLALLVFLAACQDGEGSPFRDQGNACDTSPVVFAQRSPWAGEELASYSDPQAAGEEAALPYTYMLHVPRGLPNAPVPLLLAMHGLGGSGPQFAAQSQWTRFADERKFIVAFPTGPRRWDTSQGSQDVTFIRSIVGQQRQERCIDSKRIWATGHSYGGFMTQRLACDAGDLFAAGASVSGGDVSMPVVGGPCEPQEGALTGFEPVPLAFWHGTNDQVVPYNQGRVSFDKWAERFGCDQLESHENARYGPFERLSGCSHPVVVAREEASGEPFHLQFHTYVDHRHGYPDGCGGLGQLSWEDCSPDPDLWPTLDSHHSEILDFLYRYARSSAAPMEQQ